MPDQPTMSPETPSGGGSPALPKRPAWPRLLGRCLVVAVALLLLLFAAISVKGKISREDCKSNFRWLGMCFHVYADDFDGEFPPSLKELFSSTTPSTSTEKYVDDPKLFKCPSDPSATISDFAAGDVTAKSSSYLYLPGRAAWMPGGLILLYDKPANHKNAGINVLFVDGHVEWCPFGNDNGAGFRKTIEEQEKQLPELRKQRLRQKEPPKESPKPAAATQPAGIRTKVVDVRGGSPWALGAGSDSGVKVGMIFLIHRGDEYIGKIRVTTVWDDFCAGQTIEVLKPIKPGDEAMTVPAPPPTPAPGVE